MRMQNFHGVGVTNVVKRNLDKKIPALRQGGYPGKVGYTEMPSMI